MLNNTMDKHEYFQSRTKPLCFPPLHIQQKSENLWFYIQNVII